MKEIIETKLYSQGYLEGKEDGIKDFVKWLYENYIVSDNHNEEVSVEDLLWEYSHK